MLLNSTTIITVGSLGFVVTAQDGTTVGTFPTIEKAQEARLAHELEQQA